MNEQEFIASIVIRLRSIEEEVLMYRASDNKNDTVNTMRINTILLNAVHSIQSIIKS